MKAIETHELSKDYFVGFWRPRPYRALDGMSLAVEPGEVFGFLGPNGAGKTTTLKLLMQLVFPTAGHARILGRPVGDVGVKRRLGYLPENPYFYDYLTAEELLTYFAGLFGYSGAERRTRVSRLLDEVGLGAERRMQLRKFSKGMIQRVGLAQALVNDPEVVFLDEPMSGLDPLGRRDVRALILRLRDEGRTVFFSSHILPDAETLCSRVAIVAGGRLMASGSLTELLAQQLKGWELVLDGLREAPVVRDPGGVHSNAVERVTRIAGERYAVELGPAADPMTTAAALLASGGSLVSISRLHETLEDVFVRKVGQADGADRFAPSRGAAPALGAQAAGSDAGDDASSPRVAGSRR
jgi:ABC-2 type transport system ATP-binding protein